MDEVATQLAESAPRFAREALEALSDGDDVGFALFAATSLEHLLKSFLAGRHPALIIDARSFDSLLHACGEDAAANTPRDTVKTIGAVESLHRVSRFVPSLTTEISRVEGLFGVRNGGVHLADSRSVSGYVQPFLAASEEIRGALGVDRATYWGEYIGLADQTLKEHVAAVELKVAAALAGANAAYEQRFGRLDESARCAAITALEANTFWGDEEQGLACPACGSSATAFGGVEVEWRYEEVGDDDFVAELDATFIAESFRCHVCGLHLDSPDELAVAKIDRSWRIDVDQEQYYDESYQEPDEDWYRNR